MLFIRAVSQNLIHSNISVIDDVYGIWGNNDIKFQTAALGNYNFRGEASEATKI